MSTPPSAFPPVRCGSQFAPVGYARRISKSSGRAHLHTYLTDMPDLNWREPAVQQAMFDVARFWLDRGVDGFRVDSAHIIAKDPDLRDNPPNPDGRLDFGRPHGDMDSQLHLHDRGHPDVHRIYRQFRRLLEFHATGRGGRMAMAEVALSDIKEWASYYGETADELHLPFNFRLVNVDWNPAAVRSVLEDAERAIPDASWPCWVLGNHDEPRLASRLDPARARCAILLLLTIRGTPVLYYGDELGMTDVTVPPDRVKDPWERRIPGRGFGRDPERSPMRWDSTANAGFCPSAAVPWLPMGQNSGESSVAAQIEDPRSMLALARRLLCVRRERPELALGSYRTLTSDGVLAYLRELDGSRSLVVLNLSNSSTTAELPGMGSGRVLAGTHRDDETINTSRIRLGANEGMAIALTSP
jgi:alpha-glucosidase